jgi:transglutaminase-like putative cysteine protease
MRYSALEDARAEEPARLTQCRLLLATTYATIISGGLLLAVAEHTMSYAVVAAVFCAGHALLVGPNGVMSLPGAVGKLLAIAALAYGLLQAAYASVEVSYGLAHFLVIVQLIKLYGPHTVRDLRLIHVAAIFIILVASIWALDLLYVPAFLLATISLMSGLTVLSMFPPASQRENEAARRALAWATGRHLASALVLPVTAVFGVTAVLFVLLPRVHLSRNYYRGLTEQMVGFSGTVSLHEVGQLRQSNEVVMRVQFRPGEGTLDATVKPSRVLMRGQCLAAYRDGQWADSLPMPTRPRFLARMADSPTDFTSLSTYLLRNTPVRAHFIRQKVSIESRPTRTIFALYRLTWADGGSVGLARISRLEHSVELPIPLRPGDSYDAVSLVPQFSAEDLRRVGTPRPDLQDWEFWYLPENIQPTLEAVADQILGRYPVETDYDRVVATERYLTESGLFRYTLDLPPLGVGDPIEEFLTKTHEGSCEQFSTAMALLVRVWGIPSRLAIGFKGGDYDSGTHTYTFRDKHAHAWVEVYFNGRGWVEFDPTPAAVVVPGPAPRAGGRIAGLLEGLQDFMVRSYRRVRSEWNGNVIGYSRTKQQRIMGGLSKATASLAARAAGIVGPLWPGMPGTGMVQIAALVVLLTLAGMGIYLLARWLQGKARRAGVPPNVRRTLWFYLEMLRIMQRKGILRSPHLTPYEFVPVAAAQLAPGEPGDAAPREALDLITDLYYRVRFGGRRPTPQQVAAVRQALEVLRRASRVVADRRAALAPFADEAR